MPEELHVDPGQKQWVGDEASNDVSSFPIAPSSLHPDVCVSNVVWHIQTKLRYLNDSIPAVVLALAKDSRKHLIMPSLATMYFSGHPRSQSKGTAGTGQFTWTIVAKVSSPVVRGKARATPAIRSHFMLSSITRLRAKENHDQS
mmetsp:Transcript_87505/g.136981  ORF Transcript_87505/g.136981 Transcript_87505/m.136981 type:complete len:144 (-) Transcript_87505:1-432(-)